MTTWNSVSQKKHVYTWDFWSCKFSIIPWTIPSCKQYYSRGKKDTETSVLKISMIAAAQTPRQTSFQLFQHYPQHFTDFHWIIIHCYAFSHSFISMCLIHLCACMTGSEDRQFQAWEHIFQHVVLIFFSIFYWSRGYLYVQPCVYHAGTVKWVSHEHLQDVSFPESAPRLSLATSYTCSHEECLKLAIVADLAWRNGLSTKTSEWFID